MLKFNVMSPSGKIGFGYNEYEIALKIFNENKEKWSGWNKEITHIIWIDEETEKSGKLSDEEFLNARQTKF